MRNALKILENNREELRSAQVGALLHNLGKVTSQFFDLKLNGKSSSSSSYEYQHILHLIDVDYPDIKTKLPKLYNKLQKPENQNVLDSHTISTLKQSFSMSPPLNDRTYRIGDMIEYLGQDKLEDDKKLYSKPYDKHWITEIFSNGSCFTHLMYRSHRGASGGEKQDIYVIGQTDTASIYKSTPFGWESSAFDLTDVDRCKQNIEQIIKTYLNKGITSLNFDEFAEAVRPHLETVIADTQRPLNDVTVWDIGHSGMAFLLTQAITLMAQGRPVDHDELAKIEKDNTLFWRVLGIRIDGLSYLDAAPSLADVRVRKKLLKKKLDKIRGTLEGMPVAIEVYRDENGSFYIFPDLPDNHVLTAGVLQELKEYLNVDGVAIKPFISDPFVNHPQDSGQYIGKYILQQLDREISKAYNPEAYIIPWEKTHNREICVACGVRPQGYGAEQIPDYQKKPDYYAEKARRRHICCLCMERRRDVAKNWATKELQSYTVWVDEVADKNGRVALIVGKFDLNNWEMWYPKAKENQSYVMDNPIPLLKVFNFGEPLKHGEKVILKNQSFEWDNKKQLLIGETGKNCPQKFKRNDIPELNIDVVDIQHEGIDYKVVLSKPHGLVGEQKSIMGVQFTVEDQITLKTADPQAAKKIEQMYLYDNRLKIIDCTNILQMTESQSFARIRRVWETTKKFWEEVDASFIKTVGQAGTRLEIKGELHPNKDRDTPGSYHVYEIRLENTKLSAVWDDENNRFITAENLDYLAQPEQLGQNVKDWLEMHIGQKLSIEESTGYGNKNKKWGYIKIDKVLEIINSTYIPAISILAEPRTFMAIVPANKALNVANAIKNKYEEEMNKVRNRLPLTVGLVFAKSHTPISSIMDAGRRMLNISEDVGTWKISENPDNTDPSKIELKLNKNEQCIKVKVDTLMRDKTPDVWYPYWHVESDADNKTPFNQTRQFIGHDKNIYVHVCNLQIDDKVKFTPSRFDFEFLDSAARRFEVSYKDGKRRDNRKNNRKINRPYYLEDLSNFERIWYILRENLKRTQIKNMLGLIETKREEWQDDMDVKTFEAFVHNVVYNANWINGRPEEINEIEKAAVSGKLNDIVELYMDILKDKEEYNGEEEST